MGLSGFPMGRSFPCMLCGFYPVSIRTQSCLFLPASTTMPSTASAPWILLIGVQRKFTTSVLRLAPTCSRELMGYILFPAHSQTELVANTGEIVTPWKWTKLSNRSFLASLNGCVLANALLLIAILDRGS